MATKNLKHQTDNWNSHTLLMGIQNGTATLEDRLVVPYKTKYTITMPSVIIVLGSNTKELKTYVYEKSDMQCS